MEAVPESSSNDTIQISVVETEEDIFKLDDDSNLEEINKVILDVDGAGGLRTKLDSADPAVRTFVEELETEAFTLIETYQREAIEAMSKREQMRHMVAELRNQNDILKQEMNALREVIAFQSDLETTPHSSYGTPPRLANGHRSLSVQPQNIAPSSNPPSPSFTSRFSYRRNRSHRRVQSHHELSKMVSDEQTKTRPVLDVEPEFYRQFQDWKENGYDHDHVLMQRVMQEDVEPCLRFDNVELAKTVLEEIRAGTLCLEPIKDGDVDPKQRCSLVTGRSCSFRMKLIGAEEEHKVCSFARNRVMTACEFFTYLKHLQMKLVRSEETKILSELQSLRKHMALSRLGFPVEGR